MIELTGEQQRVYDAMERFARERPEHKRVFYFCGLAGTGKTTLLEAFAREHEHAALVTYTGKAASVLRRKTGIEAMTIHSFFYRLIKLERDKQNRERMEWRQAQGERELWGKLVLIDECMMVGVDIMNDILRTGAWVIACGDPGQLLPVGQGAYFNYPPDAELTEIHRQALDSPIIRQAHRVRQGLQYRPDGEAFQVKREATVQDVIDADILLCWRKDQERQRLNARARSYRDIWPVAPQIGEPVMCRKNVRGQGIYNGAIYPLLEPFMEGDTAIVIDTDTDRVRLEPVFFEGMPSALKPGMELQTWFTFGYACTVHKAAGSEWNRVILWDQYTREERNRWLYTAITRAAQQIIIVA